MQKKRFQLFFLLAWLFFASCATARQTKPADRYIYVPVESDKEVLEAAHDMAYWLQKAGAGIFHVTKHDRPPQSGIRIQRASTAGISNVHRTEVSKDGQSFHLWADGIANVRISGSGKNSFVNGIYTFLHELGFRWYMPGDNWTIVPRLPANYKSDRLIKPDFQNRFYFGSGGISAIPGLDPDDSYSKDYLLWNKRNLWNFDYQNRGHAGTKFYAENKKVLDMHPEYFCNGKINRNGWIDVNSKQALDIFVQWARKQVVPGERFPSIGVDPADGSGGANDCLPANHTSIKTWSDKYFWLANQVAASLDKNDKVTRVQLYAYNNHAAPPGFALHPNVFPTIVPYAFQNVTSPDNFISIWAKKMNGRPMGVYDYWNITQWSKGVPQFNVYNVPERLKKWKANNITAIQIEGTYGKGPIGHIMWLASWLMWDSDQDFNKLYQSFLNDCFGAAADDIKNMYDRWSTNYVGGVEPSLALYDLNRASAKVKDPIILSRINELKAYVQYLKLYEAHLAENTVKSYEALINYTLSIHHLRIVHTSALINLYLPLPKGHTREKDKTRQTQKYGAIRPLSESGINRDFQNSLRTAIPEVVLSKSDLAIMGYRPTGDKKPVVVKYINSQNRYDFYIDKPGVFVFKAGATEASVFYILNSSNDTLVKRAIKADREKFENYSVTLPAKGEYYLLMGEKGRYTRMELPPEIVFVSSDNWYDNYQYPFLHFYIPSDVDQVVYWDQHGPGQNSKGFWINPDGKRVDAVKMTNGIYKINVEEKYKGKAWQFIVGHRSFKMINIPHKYSLSPFEYRSQK